MRASSVSAKVEDQALGGAASLPNLLSYCYRCNNNEYVLFWRPTLRWEDAPTSFFLDFLTKNFILEGNQ
jgi:hypothetical protein